MGEVNEVQCRCCKLFYERQYPRAYPAKPLALAPQVGVCWGCVHHLGESINMRNVRGREHGKMLRRDYLAERERVAEAEREVVEMRRELAMRPVVKRVEIANLDQVVVDAATRERDQAYHRRDVAMGALSDVRLLHHRRPENRDRCKCGTAYAKCSEAQIVDRWTGVEDWEQSQAGRARRGTRHYLLRDHPGIADGSYFRDRYARQQPPATG